MHNNLQRTVKLGKPDVQPWTVHVVDDKGMHLDARDKTGVHSAEQSSFTTGEIGTGYTGKDAFQQSFVGIAFHGVNMIQPMNRYTFVV